MIALDTTVLARVIVNDEPSQHPAARKTLCGGEVVITATVVLERIWVLRSIASLTDDEICDAIRVLAAWPSVTVVSPAGCDEFLRLWAGGLDSEDAAHLAFVDEVDAFGTVNCSFVKRAKNLGSHVPTTLAGRAPEQPPTQLAAA